MDTKLLIVDDDVNICGMLKLYFENKIGKNIYDVTEKDVFYINRR